MKYMSTAEAARKWGVSTRWVRHCCIDGLIPGCTQWGGAWQIPADAEKPAGKRAKSSETADVTEHLALVFNPDYARQLPEHLATQDDLVLCDIQDQMLRGDLEGSHRRFKEYCGSCKDQAYLLAALQCRFTNAFFLGLKVDTAAVYVRVRKIMKSGNYPLTRQWLDIYVGKGDREAPMPDIPDDAMSLMVYIAKSRYINHLIRKGVFAPEVTTSLELDCRMVESLGNENVTAHFHFMLATYYHLFGSPRLSEDHVKRALDISLSRRWLLIPAEYDLMMDMGLERVVSAEDLESIRGLSKLMANRMMEGQYGKHFGRDKHYDSYLLIKIAFMIVGKKTSEEMCEALGITMYSLKRYIAKLYECTNTDNRSDLSSCLLSIVELA